MEKKKVIILGDSILKAIVVGEDNKYHFSKDIDWKGLEDILDVQLINYSKMGSTITLGLDSLERAFVQEQNIHAIVIEYGGNDSDYYWDNVSATPRRDYQPKTNLETFENELYEIVRRIKEKGIKPILMTLPPIHSNNYYQWIAQKVSTPENIIYFLGDIEVIYRRQELYSNAILNLALKENIDFVDVRKEFLLSDNYPALMCVDGVHPNKEGQQLIIDCFVNKFGKKI